MARIFKCKGIPYYITGCPTKLAAAVVAIKNRWGVHRVPDFYKRKTLNEVKPLLISAKNRFRNAIDGVMIPPDERYREKSKAFEELEKALKELED